MILVADSGSTKTDWAAIGDTVQRFQSIGLNPLFFTDESLETTISGALADVAAEEVTGVYFYGSGCGLEVNRERLRKCFRSLFPNVREVDVDTDLVGAAIALFGKDKGIACILGTGANAGIYDGDLIIIKKQSTAENGDKVVALIDDEATVKTFYKEKGHYRLQPENDFMDPIIVDHVIILGIVAGLFRKY